MSRTWLTQGDEVLSVGIGRNGWKRAEDAQIGIMKSLLIVGAGKHGQVVAEVAEACGYDKIDFLDDNSPDAIGETDRIEELVREYDGTVVSIGNSAIRKNLVHRLQSINAPIVSLIHPKAFVAPSAIIGSGSIVLPGAMIHTNASIGIGCIISIGALIDHDAVVEDFGHVNTGAIVAAGKRAGGKIEAGVIIG